MKLTIFTSINLFFQYKNILLFYQFTNPKFYITWKNHQNFKIEIDDQKTILDLKKSNAAHHGRTYAWFNIINGINEIESDKND